MWTKNNSSSICPLALENPVPEFTSISVIGEREGEGISLENKIAPLKSMQISSLVKEKPNVLLFVGWLDVLPLLWSGSG